MNDLIMWEDKEKLQEIRKLFAPKLTDGEFQFFTGLAKAAQLNPYMREVWAIKYQDSAPAQVFVGRDGYRRASQRDKDYDFHQVDAVYSNDEFRFDVKEGYPEHSYNLKDRGELLGAYCIVKRKGSNRPSYTWVKLSEYSTGKSLWNTNTGKPETMIKKVAEAQGLRATFQDLLGGTYTEEEVPARMAQAPPTKESLMDKINQAKEKDADLQSSKGVVIDVVPVEPASQKQIEGIEMLIAVKDFSKDRLTKALNHYQVSDLSQLNAEQAASFTTELKKLEDV